MIRAIKTIAAPGWPRLLFYANTLLLGFCIGHVMAALGAN